MPLAVWPAELCNAPPSISLTDVCSVCYSEENTPIPCIRDRLVWPTHQRLGSEGREMKHHEMRQERLTNLAIRLQERTGYMGDGRGGCGLFVLIRRKKDGELAKTFCQRLSTRGRVQSLTLGRYPEMSLMEARSRAEDNWRRVKEQGEGRNGG